MRATDRTFGAVTVLIGEKNGKYPDGNSVLVRGRDATLLIDPSLSGAARAAELPRIDHVVQSHVHEDHLAGLFRFPHAAVHAHRHDVLGLHSLNGLMAIYGATVPAATRCRNMWRASSTHAARADAQPYDDGAVFDLGGASVRAIHLPGHTRGHCACSPSRTMSSTSATST
jgi:glyoxylase-like metal-dependent hydrolase (beta-lactamase superfamily II)